MPSEAVATMVFRQGPDGHEVLVLKRATEPFLGEWFPVEGGIDPGEAPDDAVRRELHEETSLVARTVHFDSVRVVPSSNATVRLHIYASIVSSDATVALNEEHSAFRWCSFEEARSLLPLPAQQDALSRLRERFL